MINILQMIGSVCLMVVGIISVTVSKKPSKEALLARRVLFFMGIDVFLVSVIRILKVPFGVINSDASTIITGMIALTILIFIGMELADKNNGR